MSKTYTVPGIAQPLANYPHAHRVGDMIFVSGVSCRRADNTHAGVNELPDGSVETSITAQSEAVFDNLEHILKAAGAGMDAIVDITVFLVDMDDYRGFNEVYNQRITGTNLPARTTVAVHQLPHRNLLVELKVIANISR